jgi:IclR family acetate operon transcriptional repressor
VKAPNAARPFPQKQSPPKAEGRATGGGAHPESVQSVRRALGIINQLAEVEDGMTLTRIAERVGLSPSTAHRLLTTVEQERYVRFSERRRRSVGVQTFVAGCAFLKTRDLAGVARSFMRTLMEECGETLKLAVQNEREAMYVHRIQCVAAVRPFVKPDGRVPLYCSGVGKALLAWKNDSELESLLPGDDASRSRTTQPSAARLCARTLH